MQVNTVRGPVDAADLGQTLVHEHVTTADWSLRAAFGERFFGRDLVVERAVEQFSRAAACGVRTVVDGTPVNMGRDVELIREVGERSGVRFIVSSGFYTVEEAYLSYRDEAEVHDLLTVDFTDGIAGTDIRPGMMKAACGDAGLTPVLTTVFSAIGRVAAEQGVPVFAHHHPHVDTGDAILDTFEAVGLSPSRVVLGHAGDSNDVVYLERMLQRGCYLGMDRFGFCEVGNSLADRVRTIVELCARGYADRLLLSHDLATYWGVFGRWGDYVENDPMAHGVDFTFVHDQVLPALSAAGLAPETVAAFLERNPIALFEGDLHD